MKILYFPPEFKKEQFVPATKFFARKFCILSKIPYPNINSLKPHLACKYIILNHTTITTNKSRLEGRLPLRKDSEPYDFCYSPVQPILQIGVSIINTLNGNSYFSHTTFMHTSQLLHTQSSSTLANLESHEEVRLTVIG